MKKNNSFAVILLLAAVAVIGFPVLVTFLGALSSVLIPVLVIWLIYKIVSQLSKRTGTVNQSGRPPQMPHTAHSQTRNPAWKSTLKNHTRSMAQSVREQVQNAASGQRTQSKPSSKPPTPPRERQYGMHPFYQNALDSLERNTKIIPRRRKAVDGFLDELFGNSVMTKDRYKQVIGHAQQILEDNYEKAKRAIRLFDEDGEPTAERKEIINRYVQDSDDIIQCFEKVVNELIRLQQNQTLEQGDLLDDNLKNLAETTHYYQQH